MTSLALPCGYWTKPISVDVRVISATNRALRREMDEGRFRADLSLRLRVVPLYPPPLRHRADEVAALFWHFVREGAIEDRRRIEGSTEEAFDLLLAYPWPGNVRELWSAVEASVGVDTLEVHSSRPLPHEILFHGVNSCATRTYPIQSRIIG